jgi:hypothetical protein
MMAREGVGGSLHFPPLHLPTISLHLARICVGILLHLSPQEEEADKARRAAEQKRREEEEDLRRRRAEDAARRCVHCKRPVQSGQQSYTR